MITVMCLATVLLNSSNFEFNEHDKKMVKRAKYVCANDERYTGTPCLVKFTKTQERSYQAICGAYHIERE